MNNEKEKLPEEMNIKEFMNYVNENYEFSLSLDIIDRYISFLDGFTIVFTNPERFEEIQNVLKEFRSFLNVIKRYSK